MINTNNRFFIKAYTYNWPDALNARAIKLKEYVHQYSCYVPWYVVFPPFLCTWYPLVAHGSTWVALPYLVT